MHITWSFSLKKKKIIDILWNRKKKERVTKTKIYHTNNIITNINDNDN